MNPFDWTGLPEFLRYGLLVGGEGKLHLAGLASKALAKPQTIRLGLDLLLAAWEAGPLDGGLARTLISMHRQGRFLTKTQEALLEAVARNWAQPVDAKHLSILQELAARRDHAGLLEWLSRRQLEEPGNLFWRGHLLDTAYLLGDWALVEKNLRAVWPDGTQELQEKIRADAAFQQGDFQAAASGYSAARSLRICLSRAAAAQFAQGRIAEARQTLGRAQARSPWNVNLLLRLYDLRFIAEPGGVAVQAAPVVEPDHLQEVAFGAAPGQGLESGCHEGHGVGERADCAALGRVAVCLYTAGKAADIDATLAALAVSHAVKSGVAGMVVLDNGSRDGTSQVLAAWKERLGAALEVISLPVNIGAPAARNWLMGYEAVTGSAYVAYLDDDALVPPDWLTRFGMAVAAYPEAGVWGCKVSDLPVPARIQNTDIHFLESGEDGPAFSSLCTQDLDFGQFDYLRPCLSVTGCCHLFRTRDLLASGGFDIRFSPTQYDDLDHDLRLAASGRMAVYQGHLRVGHARLSGALLNQNPAATANSQGNLQKLAGKHPVEERERLRQLDGQSMLDDVLRKQARLGEPEMERGD